MNNCDLSDKEEQSQVDAIRATRGLPPQDCEIVSFRLHWPNGVPAGTEERVAALEATHGALVRRVAGQPFFQIYTSAGEPTNDWNIHFHAQAFTNSGLTAESLHRELHSVQA